MKKTFSISEAVSFGWKAFKSNWKFWIVVLLLLGATTAFGGSDFTKEFSNSTESTLKTGTNSYSTTYMENSVNTPKPSWMNLRDFKSNVLGASTNTQWSDKKAGVFSWLSIPLIITAVVVILAISVLRALTSIIFNMGYINLIIDAARGQDLYYKTLLNQVSYKKALRYLAANLYVTFIVAFGMLLFIIPGIIFALKYSFVPFIMVDQDALPGEALKKSSQLTKGVKFKILFLEIVLGLVAVLGLLALGVGIVVAIVVSSLAQAYVYNSLLEQSKPQPQVDATLPTPLPTVGILATDQVTVDPSVVSTNS